jgi:hypothetical protein
MSMASKSSITYLLCLDNTGYRASLETRKLYRAIPDRSARAKGFVRIIDESGEDYLYPATRFAPVQLPLATRRALAKAS